MDTLTQYKKKLLKAAIINLFTALLKSAALFVFISASLISDTIHTWIVTFSQFLFRFNIGRGRLPKSRENPFGYIGKLYFFTYISTIIALSCAALYAVLIGIRELHYPLQLKVPAWLIGVYLVSAILVVFILSALLRFITRLKGVDHLITFIQKSKRVDLITTVFQETALLSTLLISMVAMLIKHLFSWSFVDGIGAMIIGLVILSNALATGMKMQDLLIGESAELAINRRIHNLLLDEEWIVDVVSLQTLQLDNATILLAVKAQFQDHLNSTEIITLASGFEQDVRHQYPDIKRVYFEPVHSRSDL